MTPADYCLLCGVSFNIGRYRTVDEPASSNWDRDGNHGGHHQHLYGCDMYLKDDLSRHWAGLWCKCRQCYSGSCILASDMEQCKQVQLLMLKDSQWSQEPTDEDFVIDSELCYLSGISQQPPYDGRVYVLSPVRHGVSGARLLARHARLGDFTGAPFHPYCFELFKKLSLQKLGKVHLDGLWKLREYGMTCLPDCSPLQRDPNVAKCRLELWLHEPGTEYLASNPLDSICIENIIGSCVSVGLPSNDPLMAGQATGLHTSTSSDPFQALPGELLIMILSSLGQHDIANLRLSSRMFRHLPQQVFATLIKKDMPWAWEAHNLKGQIDYHQLWRKLSAASLGNGVSDKQRQYLGQIRDGKIASIKSYHISSGLEDQDDVREINTAATEQAIALYEHEKSTGKGPAFLLHQETEIKELRNRRRIWKDLEEITDRISRLDVPTNS